MPYWEVPQPDRMAPTITTCGCDEFKGGLTTVNTFHGVPLVEKCTGWPWSSEVFKATMMNKTCQWVLQDMSGVVEGPDQPQG